MSSSVILNEEIDEDYEPNEDELLEYAKFLGMEFPEDDEFLYIAKEGLKAPLPEPWKPCQTKTGDIYFFNFDTGESVWEHPCDTYYKDLFIEAKNKKKTVIKRPPLQETKERSKKPIIALPKSVSPVTFEKKRDLLSEMIQLEKDFKEKKNTLKEKLENELNTQLKDISLQRDIEIKLFKEQLEKESKKKLNQLLKELENVDEVEKKNFVNNLNGKFLKIKNDNEKLFETERKKIQEKIDNEISTFDKEQVSIMKKKIESEKSSLENEKKFFSKELEERKELYERQKTSNLMLQEELKQEFVREESKLRKNNEKYLDEYKRDQEHEVQKAVVSARNRKAQSTLQEKIRELKEEYKVKEEVEKRNAIREYEDELRDLYKDINFTNPKIDKEWIENERNKELEELYNKYKVKKRDEMAKIDQEFEKTLNLKKEILDAGCRDKISMFKEKQPKINYTDLEQKIIYLAREASQAKEKIAITEDTMLKYQKIVLELKRQYDYMKNTYEKEHNLLPKSEKIKELKQKLSEKDQELERLKNHNPDKLEKLENELKEIKSLINPILNERPSLNYEEKVKVKKIIERGNKKKNEDILNNKNEELKENFISDDDFIADWKRDDGWNLSRDISPVGIEIKQNAYRRPQNPTRTWIKPRDDIGRFSAEKIIGPYLY